MNVVERSHLPHHVYVRLQAAGISLGILTIILEAGCILTLLFQGHFSSQISYLLFFAAGCVAGILAVYAWYCYGPSDSEQIIAGGDMSEKLASETSPEQESREEQNAQFEDESINITLQINNALPHIDFRSVAGSLSPFPAASSHPSSLRCFVFPKEGHDPEYSQDKWAMHTGNTICRYAVADGTGASFLPGQWAHILVTRYVELQEDFQSSGEFTHWLTACSQQWHEWVDTSWIPATNQKLGQEKDWSRDRALGAQTTFTGCSFSPLALFRTGETPVQVAVVGDTLFFLLHPPENPSGQWHYSAFAYETPDTFGPVPDTLTTAAPYIQDAWKMVRRDCYIAHTGDYLILATDALAKWILTQTRDGFNPWKDLLSLSHSETFGQFVLRERDRGALEVDDTTLMIIPL